MKREKVLLLSVLILAGFLFASSFVFGQEDPELAPFDATVTVGNTPPTLLGDNNGGNGFLSVVDVPDNEPGFGTIQPLPGLNEGPGIIEVSFSFVAEDPNGVDDLPGLAGPAISEGTNIIVTLTEPANDANAGTNTVSAVAGDCSATSCVGNADCPDQSAGTNQKEYTCVIEMNYYDPSSPNSGATADDRWTISVTVFDSTLANSATAASGDSGFTDLTCDSATNCDYITYNEVDAVSTAGSLSWTPLDINSPDNPADGSLALDNAGNTAVNSEDVTAQDLVEPTNAGPCTPATDDCLLVAAFSAGDTVGAADSGACDAVGGGGAGTAGVNLVDESAVTVNVPISYSATGTDSSNMFFCVWDVANPTHITNNPATTYVANAANSNRWQVVFNS